jgi:hypothetical protein
VLFELKAELNGAPSSKRTDGHYGWSAEEVMEGRLEVQDHEIKGKSSTFTEYK